MQDKQRIATTDSDESDVFGYHYENGMVAVNLFHLRGGKIVDRREFFWEDLPEFLEPDIDTDVVTYSTEARSKRLPQPIALP